MGIKKRGPGRFCFVTLLLSKTSRPMVEGTHLHDELAKNPVRVTVQTPFGPVVGGRANNGSVIFLGM